ncbi:MAG TPA: hypothetical protein VEH84_07160 [Alphaproteobacteria bacterium]|nr:hypothetical protein [Alphaproteobacteria bacterium]
MSPAAAAAVGKPEVLPGFAEDICGRYIAAAERQLGIPGQLLAAISIVESGRWDRGIKARIAWPWTVTANGEGKYLPSKAAAIAEVRRLQKAGTRSIDIGCMQVNLHYHGDAFASLEEAFEPLDNVAYAATFLRELKAERGGWTGAMAWYHSRNRVHNLPYSLKVQKAWAEQRRLVAAARREAYQARRLQAVNARRRTP